MAQKTWRGDAIAKAQVEDYTFGGTWEADDLVVITINGKTLSVTAGSTVIDTIIATVVAAFNDLDATVYPEFSGEITASAPATTKLRFTANTAGLPFTLTVTTTEANGGAADAQTISAASVVQASKGPNHYDDANNWAPVASVPANDDDIDFTRSTVPVLYGTDQSTIHPNTVQFPASFTAEAGLPDWNPAGYYEYRNKPLTFNYVVAGVRLGDGPGQGSKRLRLKVTHATTVTTVDILGSGQSDIEGVKAIQLELGAANNVVNVTRGSVEIAGQDGQTAKVATLRVGYQQNQASDSDVYCGSGCGTITAVEKSGGRLETNSTVTTGTQLEGDAGDWFHQAGAITTLNAAGGRVVYNSTTALGTPTLDGTALLDFSQDPRPKTITNPVEINSKDAHLHDPLGVVNVGGNLVMDYNHVHVEINGVSVGTNVRLTRAATA